MSRNRVIGRDNQLPWQLPDELRHFKDCTLGKAVIMGRRTFESLPFPLRGRLNIVLTRKRVNFENVIVVNSLDKALRRAKQHCSTNKLDECFVIGGAKVYEEALPRADRLYATTINADIPGDVYFPEYDESHWLLVSKTHHPQDSKHVFSYDIRRYERVT